ncbi:MAG TPA: NAD(P)/FAD-dependent oxidoreductase [Acidimicrobiales bacterium]|nr:NAD(P)/FAD-dependent oxidoreductase [Acidimicrobiales bacterium]
MTVVGERPDGAGGELVAAAREDPGATDGLPVVVVGAGPAGLTAAHRLTASGDPVVVVEADDVVGGISRTVERDGWRFDLGGHRFFTKVPPVEEFWNEVLPPEEFLLRPRLSRIYYGGKFYDYPIRLRNALSNLGLVEAVRCGLSFLWVRIRPPKDATTLEGYIVRNYGSRLYRHFFKTYNEKVWGVSASELSADWGAQRIKGMSLWNAVWEPIRSSVAGARRSGAKQVTSLIEQFHYPKLGPGLMWERCAEQVVAQGGTIRMATSISAIHRRGGRARAVTVRGRDAEERMDVAHVISSMPLTQLVRTMDPPAPAAVLAAADSLHYRDFLTVALVVPHERGFPDNWIYIHSPEVKVGRIQNFGSWSPCMVKEGRTCLGLEYFVFEGDDLWCTPDEDLVAMAKEELAAIGLVDAADAEAGYVVRMPKAYPVYDEGYRDHVETIRRWLEEQVPNVHPVGRNGMHKYNNQDHSMYTAMLTVENIHGAAHDIWAVNVEEEYHEAVDRGAERAPQPEGPPTGRDAPTLPRRGQPVGNAVR